MVTAKYVIYTPDLTTNLLFTSRIAKTGNSIDFDPLVCRITKSRIKISRKDIFTTASEINSVYKFDVLRIIVSTVILNFRDICNRRFAHLIRRDMKMLINKVSMGISCKPDEVKMCITCLKGITAHVALSTIV